MRNKEIYGNWKVYDMHGDLLNLCLKKRADWYLSRGLADTIGENEIQLKFETKGRRSEHDIYSISQKENKCVVCGTDDLKILTRHHIAPSEYRKFFPVAFKTRSSHDVVPICREHHSEYELIATERKQAIADEFGVPMEGNCPENVRKGLKLARFLLNHPSGIPDVREIAIQMKFSGLTGINEFSPEILSEYVDYWNNFEYKTSGQMVVEKLIDDDMVYDFVVGWRQHFLDTMNPRFMPDHWDVYRKLVMNYTLTKD